MSWKTVNLGDLCSVITKGTTPSNIGASFTDKGIKYIRSEMLTSAKYVTGDFLYISKETHEKLKRSQLNTGDILFSMAGVYLGKTAILRAEDIPSNTNQAVALIRIDPNKCNNEYVYYYLNIPDVVKTANTVQSQSAQPNINLKQIGQLKIQLPDLDTQRRIASILSAYDDFIENNQKQIKLLEEAAQRLYKEWFVDLHFPGWEETKIVDGVPEGWEKCLLYDVADVNKLNLPKNNEYDSIDYIDLSSVKKGHILEKTRYKINEAPGRAKRLAIDGDIIWGMVRPNLCSYALVMHPNERDVFSTGFAVISSKKVPFSYLYCLATEESFIGYLVNCTNGAAYPAVKPIHFEEAKILKPVDEILNQFHSIAEPIYRKIEALDKMVISLAEARDRLLPKLMSGELEV